MASHRDLEAAVERHALADDIDIVSAEVEFRLDRLGAESYRTWIAVDSPHEVSSKGDTTLARIEGEFVGFVTAEVDRSPSVFDHPDRLRISELYVAGPYRGSELARDLVDRATERARDARCEQLILDIDVDKERAVAFYEKLGFEPYRYQMLVSTDSL